MFKNNNKSTKCP